ncbi:MAG: UPF0149 family protein [Gammaproteobacteria bacterium]|nr:UPF0149 family protein [Gammaproteobacteria bacterium]MDH5652499.1 UPF0149 family protein [Gammaproteobacteria bacterium]
MNNFDRFASAIRRIGVAGGAAELHGQMIGLLCARQTLTAQQWLDEAVPELAAARETGDALAAESAVILGDLFQQSQACLDEREFAFELLLPADEFPLTQRIGALGEWCQGFLLGLSMGGIKDFEHLPGEVPELLNDMVEISRADSYELADESEDESAYVELMEYVRLGVMMVWEEIHQLYAARSEQPSIH